MRSFPLQGLIFPEAGRTSNQSKSRFCAIRNSTGIGEPAKPGSPECLSFEFEVPKDGLYGVFVRCGMLDDIAEGRQNGLLEDPGGFVVHAGAVERMLGVEHHCAVGIALEHVHGKERFRESIDPAHILIILQSTGRYRVLPLFTKYVQSADIATIIQALSVSDFRGKTEQQKQDMLAANNWNVVQYSVLVHMMAQVSGLESPA